MVSGKERVSVLLSTVLLASALIIALFPWTVIWLLIFPPFIALIPCLLSISSLILAFLALRERKESRWIVGLALLALLCIVGATLYGVQAVPGIGQFLR